MQKNMNKLTYILLSSAIVLASCSDWLDVKPKTNVEEEDLFKNEQGFKEALTGAYIEMSRNNLYGQNLTYGYIDFLAQRYSVVVGWDGIEDFSLPTWYEFEQNSDNTVRFTNTIWSESYNLIANLNNLLSKIETHGDAIITKGYRDLMKGEALGLRSFLYFDMLRMWGPIYKDNPTSPTIPYRTAFDRSNAKLLPAKDLADSIIVSLKAAEQLLENDGMALTFPIYGETSKAEPFLRRRYKRMNKYAVKAEPARVYMYIGDKTNAALYANEIVNAKKENGSKMFALITDNSTDHLGSTELIFSLSMDSEKFGDEMKENFQVSNGSNFYINGKSRINELFDTSVDGNNDMRVKEGAGFQFSVDAGYTLKYTQNNFSYALDNTMPLIRLPEMYYILAECTDDLAQSAKYISLVRGSRGVDDVEFTNRDEQLYNIEKEYRKEFYAEGQLWYFYKRHGYKTFQFCTLEKDLTEANYRFSIPDDEITLGNIN